MTFTAAEISNFLGRPIRLYTFQRDNALYFYNNSDRDVTYDGNLFTRSPIKDNGLKQKGEASSDDYVITVPADNPIALAFQGSTVPSQLIRVFVRDVHSGDTESPLVWTGFVSTVRIKDTVSYDLSCNTYVAYLNRRGLRLAWTRMCPHVLYDEQCQLIAEDWGEGATVTALNAVQFNFALTTPIAGANPTRFSGGFVEWAPAGSNGDYIERRPIDTHTDDGILMLTNTDGLAVGTKVVIYPGCERTPACCHRFNNIANYGGFPMMPGKSPFDGDPVF